MKNTKLNFNEAQLEAINTLEGKVAVVASAGSGKTTVLTHRVRKLVDSGVNPSEILVSTFTRKSAEDLTKRLSDLGISVEVGTFHSICGKILSKEGINVSKKIPIYMIDNAFKRMNQGKSTNTLDILNWISYQKNYGKTPKDKKFVSMESNYSEEELALFFKVYEQEKKKSGAYDFDDYLTYCLKVLKMKPNKYTYKHILIDEFQDNNNVQSELMKCFCPLNNIFTVFDYRQAIYGFRGGNAELCMDFAKEQDTKLVDMNTNYRSDKIIVEASNAFIRPFYSKSGIYSDTITHSTSEGVIKTIEGASKEDEAFKIGEEIERLIKEGENPEDIMVLYRNNNDSMFVENELKTRKIEFNIENNGSFFKRKEIDIVMCMLRLIHNKGKDDSAYETIVKSRCNYFQFLPKKVLEDIIKLSGKEDISYFEASKKVNCDKAYDKHNLREFTDQIRKLILWDSLGKSVGVLIDNIIKTLKLEEYIIENNTSKTDQDDKIEALKTLKLFVKNNNLESFLNFVYSGIENDSKKKKKDKAVDLMTVHKSKGLERKIVFLIGVNKDKFPSAREENILNEANVFYVGVTRAKNMFYISCYEPSIFFREYCRNVEFIKG